MKAIKPTAAQRNAAKKHNNKTFARLLKDNDILLRAQIGRIAKERDLWDDDKEAKLEEVRKQIIEGEAQLSRGGKTADGEPFSKSDAKELALKMMDARSTFLILNSTLQEFDQYTCEAQAENAEFDYLCSVCIVDDDEKPLFKGIGDYRDKSDDPDIEAAAAELAKITTSYDEDWYDKLPEVSFLLKYKFVNGDYQLIDEDGNTVDESGNKVNKEGQLVNEQNELINEFGDRIDEEGNNLDFVEFVD